MSKQPFAATPWEVEAARRREVVASDFPISLEDRVARSTPPAGSRVRRWFRSLASRVAGEEPISGTRAADRGAPARSACHPASTALNQGS